jgi:TRAP-type C4-dicarboxylate transport system permease small subunit
LEAQRPADTVALAWVDRFVIPALSYAAGAVLFSLMLLTCADVVARYFLNKPITGGFELTECLLAALIFAGLPLVTLKNEHVTVDLFDAMTPDWLFHLQHIAACLVGALCMGFLGWRLWLRAAHMSSAGETTAALKFSLGPLVYGMSALTLLAAAAMLVLMLRKPSRHYEHGGGGAA